MNFFAVIPSEVEESRGATEGQFRGVSRLRGVYPERAKRVERASLGMTGNWTLAIFFCLVFTIASSAVAQTNAGFTKANQEYAQGHFKEAISGYEVLVRGGQWSANLFYDLGNAYFRTGDFGHAILNYERALALERHHPEATANLQIARDEARALELQQSWPERYLQFASVNQLLHRSGHRFLARSVCGCHADLCASQVGRVDCRLDPLPAGRRRRDLRVVYTGAWKQWKCSGHSDRQGRSSASCNRGHCKQCPGVATR